VTPQPTVPTLQDCVPVCLLREITGKECEKCIAKVFKGEPKDLCDADKDDAEDRLARDRSGRDQFCRAVCTSAQEGCAARWCTGKDCGDDS
jgi:hypothetical protein